MFKIIIPILVIALAAFVGMNAKGGLIRGVADGMLVSPARPAVAVKPAADFASVDARRVDLSPSVQNGMLQATSVQAVYAMYSRPQAPAHLVALLAVSQNGETWPVEPEPGFPPIRHKKQDINGFSGFADTYVLDSKDDPWASDEPGLWENGSLVRRFTFVLWFYKAKLIVEYREPLPAPSDMPLEDNIPLLAAFEARALEAFQLLNGDPKNGGVELPRPKEKLPYPPAGINRQALTDFIGTLWDMKKYGPGPYVAATAGEAGKRHAGRRAESRTPQGATNCLRAWEKSGCHSRYRRGGHGQPGHGRRKRLPGGVGKGSGLPHRQGRG